MSIHFHPLTVRSVRKETADCVSVVFEIPEQLRDQFAFTQGQSLTMRTRIAGEEVRRTYSLCSSPLDNEWRVAIKKVDGGLFSSFANDMLRSGDVIEVMPPVGKFNTALNRSHKKNYLAFAAGSGITPVLSIIKTTLRVENDSQFTLVYGNRSRSSIIFFEELEALKNKYVDRFQVIHILSRERTDTPLNSGRIDPDKLMALGKIIDYNGYDDFFVCGPEALIFCVKAFLEDQGVESSKIHFELFTTPGQKGSTVKTRIVENNSGPKSRISLKLDGRMFDFDLAFNGNTILDEALQQGADLPYACKGGVCCTCKAKLLEGDVEMDVHWGLEEEEVKQGFILTCQSHPKSDRIVVDFDIK